MPPIQHFPYLLATALLLSLSLQFTVFPQRSLYPHNPWSISSSVRCLRSLFHVVSPPQVYYSIRSCAMRQQCRPFLPPSPWCLYLMDYDVIWIASSICWIYQLVVARCSFLEHSPLYYVLTILLCEMLDVARYGLHGGKLRLLCQSWYA